MRVVLISLAFLFFTSVEVLGEEQADKVRIADPFIELHSQPGEGHPVFHVVDRGQWVTILKRQTDWFKVKTDKGKVGWVSRLQMAQTLAPSGEKISLGEKSQQDFSERGWELGTLWGNAEGSDIFKLFAAYSFNENLSIEASAGQMLGTLSVSTLYHVSAIGQPFPEWRFSPYFTIGTGTISTRIRSTLVAKEDSDDSTSSVGFGVRAYLSRSFFFRLEYRELILYSSTDDNKELEIWSVGVGSFF